jgi:hypothetical protein
MHRFALFIGIAVATFIVGVWAIRGFPVYVRTASVQQLQPTIDATFGDDKTEERRERRKQAALADPQYAKRNPLRMDTLQAATGYALSPCDAGMKVNLVAALHSYAIAYAEGSYCNPLMGCSDAALENANILYSSPLDLRVRDALHEAFEKGGITKDNFPPKLHMTVMTLANSQGSPVSACAQANAGRRS